MMSLQQSHEPALPASKPLHKSLGDEVDPTESTSVDSSVSSKDPLGIPRSNSGSNLHRIRELRQQRKLSMGLVQEEEKTTDSPKGMRRSDSGNSIGMRRSDSGNSIGMTRTDSGNTINRIREYRKKRQESIGDVGMDISTHSMTFQRHASSRRLDGTGSDGSRHNITWQRHPSSRHLETSNPTTTSSANTSKRHSGMDTSSHSVTWQRHNPNPMAQLSEDNEMNENPLLSPGATRQRLSQAFSQLSTRRLMGTASGDNEMNENPLLSPGATRQRLSQAFSELSTRRLMGTASGASTRRLDRDASGASTRRLDRDSSGVLSPRRLTRDATGSIVWSRNRGSVTPQDLAHNHSIGGLSISQHTTSTTGTSLSVSQHTATSRTSLSVSQHSTLSLADDQRKGSDQSQPKERSLSSGPGRTKPTERRSSLGTKGSLSRGRQPRSGSISSSQRSVLSRTEERRRRLKQAVKDSDDCSVASNASNLDSLPENSNVKGTTLELLALIKKRRQARSRGRGGGGGPHVRRLSLSPVPAKKAQPTRRRSVSLSPERRKRAKEPAKIPIPDLPLSDEEGDGQPKKWSYNAHSVSKRNLQMVKTVNNDSDSSDSDSDSDRDDDEDSHDSPTGVMEFREAQTKKVIETPEIDPVHQEKMKHMREEMAELQEQLRQMEEARAKDMKDLQDHFAQKKTEMMQSAKKKIQEHLESEMELKLFAMDVEKTRLQKMQDVLEKGKDELKQSIKDVQRDMKELMEENIRLDAENQEIHRMYQHLSKWVVKTTKQNQKLAQAEEKLKKIYSGSMALIVEEKLSSVYRKFMYKVAQGVNCCNEFDFELNEDVWDAIKETEEECNKEVIDINDIDDWIEEQDNKKDSSPLGRVADSDDEDDESDGLATSIRTRSTLDEFDISKRSVDRSIDGSRRSIDMSRRSIDMSKRMSRESMQWANMNNVIVVWDDDQNDFPEEEEEYESETEVDEEFEEDIDQLNESVEFYENVLAEVSVSLDANQMSTLQDNKDMLISIFKFLDVDGSGDIDLEEFKVGIELLNKRLPEDSHFSDAETLFKMLDVDNSGTVDLEEFERVFD